jgi:hypothetical protein
MTNPGNTGPTGAGGTGTDPGTGEGGTNPPAGEGGTGTGTPSPDDWADAAAWRAFADEAGITPAEIKRRLEHSRQWETRAKANKTAADKASTLEQQIETMRTEMAERDQRDLERTMRTAGTDLRAALVDLGMTRTDAQDAVEDVDLSRFLTDGDLDSKKIEAAAKRLARVAGRVAPDRDQGAGNDGGGTGKRTMNDWVRTKVQERR